MFFIISQMLSFLINPITWIIFFLFWALFTKKPERRKRLLIITLIITLFFSNSFIVDEAVRLWEIHPAEVQELNFPYDVGIVLAGGIVTYDERDDRLCFRDNPDRFLQAIELYKRGEIKKIFLVGGAGNLIFPEMKEAKLLKKFLLNIGIPENDILIESESNNTYQNVAYAKQILDSLLPDVKFLLITSSYHMRRSLACFKKNNISIAPYPTDVKTGKRRYDFKYLIIPQSSNFGRWYMLLHETIGYIVYDIVGYI